MLLDDSIKKSIGSDDDLNQQEKESSEGGDDASIRIHQQSFAPDFKRTTVDHSH